MPVDLTREILEQHHVEAFRWAMSCCNYKAEQAEEVMQMVYIAILENKAVYSGESSLRTWLFGVIRNISRQQVRSLGVFERLRLTLSAGQEEDGEPLGSDEPDEQDETTRVWAAIRRLSPRQRQIIELVYYRGFTLNETAKVLGIGLGTVRQQFHRAKKALEKQLQTEQ